MIGKQLRTVRKQRPPVGAQPGTLAIATAALPPLVHVIDYGIDVIRETRLDSLEGLVAYERQHLVTWYDVQGVGDERILQHFVESLDIHPLAMADAVNMPNRPKAEEYENFLFIITAMAKLNEIPRVELEQISIFLGKNYVLTLQRGYHDLLDPVRVRLRQGKGGIRKNGSDYLAYAILDTVIDGYYPVLEVLGEYFEDLETRVVEASTKQTLGEIYHVRREILTLRRVVWPTREAVSSLIRDESKYIKKSVRLYLRDCYDHCVEVIDVIENFRELAGDLTDVFLSGTSNRLNEVMKVLTIISTIFIPLSFIAGIYGMNFEYMPELKYKWSYPIFWIVILVTISVMLWFFYSKGWITSPFKSKDRESDGEK